MGFTVYVKLFGHSVPNENDTDVGIFSGHQEVLFSKSPDISQLFFMDKGRCSCGWRKKAEQEGLSPSFRPLRRLRNSLISD